MGCELFGPRLLARVLFYEDRPIIAVSESVFLGASRAQPEMSHAMGLFSGSLYWVGSLETEKAPFSIIESRRAVGIGTFPKQELSRAADAKRKA